MGDVVNLRMARKAKARGTAAAQAQANRAQHGRTKGEKVRDAADAARLARAVEGARREPIAGLPIEALPPASDG